MSACLSKPVKDATTCVQINPAHVVKTLKEFNKKYYYFFLATMLILIGHSTLATTEGDALTMDVTRQQPQFLKHEFFQIVTQLPQASDPRLVYII